MHPNARLSCIALGVTLLVLPTSHVADGFRQKDPPVVTWYMPRNERLKLYPKVEVWGGGPNQATVLMHWVTPAMARACVSFSIDHDKIGAEVAETRYRGLRQANAHVVIVGLLSSPFGTAGTRMQVRLATQRDKAGVEGT